MLQPVRRTRQRKRMAPRIYCAMLIYIPLLLQQPPFSDHPLLVLAPDSRRLVRCSISLPGLIIPHSIQDWSSIFFYFCRYSCRIKDSPRTRTRHHHHPPLIPNEGWLFIAPSIHLSWPAIIPLGLYYCCYQAGIRSRRWRRPQLILAAVFLIFSAQKP